MSQQVDQKASSVEVSGSGQTAPRAFVGKVKLGLMSALFGIVGAHWWLLGRRGAWLVTLISIALMVASSFANVWWENPAFFLLLIPIVAGFIEAIVFCLMSDERFDARYNPGLIRPAASGWGPVLVAGFTLLFGTIILMFGIAMIVLYVWTELGWLDGFDLSSN